MKSLKIKATTACLDCKSTVITLQGSFVAVDGQFTEQDYQTMIDRWICIEDEKEVLDTMCEDKIEELEESYAKPAAINDADDDNEPDPMEGDIGESDMYTYLEAVEVLQKLEQSACKLGINEAAMVHLDRCIRALHSSNAKKPKQDTTLHAFYTKK